MAIDPVIFTQNVTEIAQSIKEDGPEIAAFVWGSPGIGKTDSLNQTFSDHTIRLILAGCSEPTDIGGCPDRYWFNEKAVAMDILPPVWAWKASTEAPEEFWIPTMLFFDDLTSGHEQTQNATYKVFGEHRVGNLELRDDVYLIGAGNRVGDRSGAFEMGLALGNRMRHYYAVADVDAWLVWALKAGVHPLITSYIRARTDVLDQFEAHLEGGSGESGFATPRTWEMLSKSMLKKDATGGIGSWLYGKAMGCVGTAAAVPFEIFAKGASGLVAPQDIVNDPYNAKIPMGTDVVYATLCSLEHFINQKKNHKHWINAVRYVVRDGIEPEYGILIAKMAITIAFDELGEDGRAEAIATPEFTEMFDKFGLLLDTVEEDES